MKINLPEFSFGLIILALLGSWCLAVEEDSYAVVYVRDGVPQREGKLSFTEDEIVYESDDGKEMGSWSYSDVKVVDLNKSRLFQLELAWGETFSFSRIEGERYFNQSLAAFLRGKNPGAKIKM